MDTISAYFQLVKERPGLFKQSEKIPLVLDEDEMRTFSEKTGKPMGVVYENLPYYFVLADLCRGKNGLYSYARVIYANPKSGGGVAIPRLGYRLGLLRIFRHTAREWSLEFPRGFAEDQSLTAEENIAKELSEELNISRESCQVAYLGDVRADSGLSDGKAQVFLAELAPGTDVLPAQEEGIGGFIWVEEEQLRKMIREGEITDGFTISAYARLLCADETGKP